MAKQISSDVVAAVDNGQARDAMPAFLPPGEHTLRVETSVGVDWDDDTDGYVEARAHRGDAYRRGKPKKRANSRT